MDEKDEREIIIEKYRKGRDKLDKAEINAWEDPDFDIYHATDRYGFIQYVVFLLLLNLHPILNLFVLLLAPTDFQIDYPNMKPK